jgi:hypothetical protein
MVGIYIRIDGEVGNQEPYIINTDFYSYHQTVSNRITPNRCEKKGIHKPLRFNSQIPPVGNPAAQLQSPHPIDQRCTFIVIPSQTEAGLLAL